MSFTISSNEMITDALGDISQLPDDMKMAVTSRIEKSFKPIPRPRNGDWLAQYEESGQTMKSFQLNLSKAVPHETHNTIYIQPIGSFDHPR
ncbi:unnamed protein product [Adineta steineri]|nr:unnamed protein product [Adineta steineri]